MSNNNFPTPLRNRILILIALFMLLSVLKLTGVIAWSWWWICAPLWFFPVIAITVTIVAIITVFFVNEKAKEQY